MRALGNWLPFACWWVLVLARCAFAVSSEPGEFQARNAWVQRVFASSTNASGSPCLRLLREDVAEPLTRGRSWRGTPYQLGDKTYRHGIAFNASKTLQVDLGVPARQFTAEVGLENNDDTRRGETLGQGSVTFQVVIDGKEKFNSGVRRRKDAPVRLEVPLGGAQQFEISVGDAGDGRGWDQALWAEAVVELTDGSVLRLQDLPLASAADSNGFPFSFRYGAKPSSELLARWRLETSAPGSSANEGLENFSFADPGSGLRLGVEATRFPDFPAIEWLLRLTNAGPGDTSILEAIQPLDAVLPLALSGPATLHWARGAVASFDDFAPQRTELKPGGSFALESGEGRSSSQVLPFFNIEGANCGIVLAVGWSGEWRAEFSLDQHGRLRVSAGLKSTHLLLHPAESIRTPRMLALFYQGDRWRGQNLLRQFLLAHHRPRVNGQPLVAPITCGNWGGTTAEVHLDNIRQIVREELPIAYYWIDAEWFGNGPWPVNVGNWDVKRDLYPEGFRPLSDALRRTGRELMLWFEPERVCKNSRWHHEHPDWLLGAGQENALLNLGLPAARAFLAGFVSDRIGEFGLGCYRQDFNIDPLPYWREADPPDRQGITESKYIEGLYWFWDELLRRHPGLLIDNCASGGRRIDLETLGRATPFWRTDGPRDPVAHQCHTLGLLPWVPLSATSQDKAGDDYEFRSSMCSALCLNWWVSGDVPSQPIPSTFPFAWARKVLAQYLQTRDFYYGDFYPLSTYGQKPDTWVAYQLDRPDSRKGLVVALRRPESPYETARFPLRGSLTTATYRLVNLDTSEEISASGSDLMQRGLEIRIAQPRGTALFTYEERLNR